MAKKKRKHSSVGLYIMIALCFLTSAVALWGALSKLKVHQESAAAYHELQQEVVAQEMQPLSESSAFEQEEYVPKGLEEQETNQEDTMWFIEMDKPRLEHSFERGEATAPPATTQATQPPLENQGEAGEPTESAAQGPAQVQEKAEATVTPQAAAAAIPQGTAKPQGTVTPQAAAAAKPQGTAKPQASIEAKPQGTAAVQTTVTPQASIEAKPQGATKPQATAEAQTTDAPEGTARAKQNITSEAAIPGTQTLARQAQGAAETNTQATAEPKQASILEVSEEDASPSAQATMGLQADGASTPLPPPVPMKPKTAASASTAPSQTSSPTPAPTPKPTEEPEWQRFVDIDEVHYTVNFPYLKTVYPNVVAWLLQEGTNINYPVMQAKNNDYYLDRMFNGRENEDGSVFMDSGNSAYFVDANTYLYAHNTKVGTMFSTLSNYASQEYYEQHPGALLLTPYADFKVDFFASTVSLVEEEAQWRVKQFSKKAEFEAYLEELKGNSLFKSDVSPEWGDQWLVLCTCTNIRHGQRYVVYGRMRQIRYGTEETITLTKMNIDAKPTSNGKVQVGPLGEMMVYGQNDQLWAGLQFDGRGGDKKRSFGDGGAGPTAVAMAVANLVPEENLPRITGYSNTAAGYTFCTCSVNQYYCNKKHAQYQIQTPEEFARYLPMAMASFTTGNNLWSETSRTGIGGTSMRFVQYIAGIYKLQLTPSLDISGADAALARGGMAVCSTGANSPFAKGSHYVVLAGMDETHYYLLDPFRRTSYQGTDAAGLLEVVAPGVVRTKKDNAQWLGLNAFYILEKGR